MTRRRRWWVVAAALLLVAGAVVVWTSLTAERVPPCHFWIKAENLRDPSPRIFASPGGLEITGWTVARVRAGVVSCSRAVSLADRVRAWVGVDERPRPGIRAKLTVTPSHAEGWAEYAAIELDAEVVEEGVVDPRLVGEWSVQGDRNGTLSLRADGSSRFGSRLTMPCGLPPPALDRWRRFGEVVLLVLEPTGGRIYTEPWVIEPGGRLLRRWNGDTAHKLE